MNVMFSLSSGQTKVFLPPHSHCGLRIWERDEKSLKRNISKPTGILKPCVITSITTPLVILPLLFWFLSHQPDRTMWSMAPPSGMYTVSFCVAWTTLNHTLNFTSPLQQASWSTPGGTSFGQLCFVFYTPVIFLGDWWSVQNVFLLDYLLKLFSLLFSFV